MDDVMGKGACGLGRGDGGTVFVHGGVVYELTSHPYEPCMHVRRGGEIIHVLHNAFDAHDLPERLEGGGTLRGIDGRDYDEAAFCAVLAATLESGRYEMDFSFAAALARGEVVRRKGAKARRPKK